MTASKRLFATDGHQGNLNKINTCTLPDTPRYQSGICPQYFSKFASQEKIRLARSTLVLFPYSVPPSLWSTTAPNVPTWYRPPNSTPTKKFHTSTELVHVCLTILVGHHHSLTRHERSSGVAIYGMDWSATPMPTSSRAASIVVNPCHWTRSSRFRHVDRVTADDIRGFCFCVAPSAEGRGTGEDSSPAVHWTLVTRATAPIAAVRTMKRAEARAKTPAMHRSRKTMARIAMIQTTERIGGRARVCLYTSQRWRRLVSHLHAPRRLRLLRCGTGTRPLACDGDPVIVAPPLPVVHSLLHSARRHPQVTSVKYLAMSDSDSMMLLQSQAWSLPKFR